MDTQPIEEAEPMSIVGENRYGKSRVRLLRVNRTSDNHELREWMCEVLLRGDFDECFSNGDNSKILPTDTMKNTVYSLARKSSATCMEELAKELVDFFLARNPQVSSAQVQVSETPWEHAPVHGRLHPATFIRGSNERQTARLERAQGGQFTVQAGLENLVMMKTANSGFEGYIQDSLTTLPPTADRLFATAVRATWTYKGNEVPWATTRRAIRNSLIEAFAGHISKSVQHTLYAMGDAVLNAVPEVVDIELAMPNIHCLLVDLSRFGQDNPNMIFVPTDEPHGYIEARLRRQA
jgi:urate oxidase